MITRFEKALKQVAQEDSDLKTDRVAVESHAQKVRRLEELIRAKEATGDRIVIGIGAALVLSAMALPVYAAFYRDGYVYLPSVGGPIATRSSLAGEQLQIVTPPELDRFEQASATTHSTVAATKTSTRRRVSEETPFAHYVIHRATEASALIEGPNGLWWVTPGMKIPGAGQILSIERSDGGWAVVTSETTITQAMVGSTTN
jgi:hypothetical protein